MKVAKEKPIKLSKGDILLYAASDNWPVATNHTHPIVDPPYEIPKVHLSVYQEDMLYIKNMLDDLCKDVAALIERMDEFEERDA